MKFFFILFFVAIATTLKAQDMPQITPAFISYVENFYGVKFEKVWKNKSIHTVKNGEYKVYQKYDGANWVEFLPKEGDQMLFLFSIFYFSRDF